MIPTGPHVAIYQRGHLKPAPIPCELPHWTGGQVLDSQYVANDLRRLTTNPFICPEVAPMTTERITRHYDRHTLETAGDDLPHVWTEEESAALWEKALVWSAGILVGLAFWYGTVVLLASLWRRVF